MATELFAQYGEKVYDDEIFKRHVKSVQLYPISNLAGQEMLSPIIPLSQPHPLLLQFDLLQENYSQLQARIVHCNADWRQSNLNEIEYLKGYNSIDINDFDYSINTKVLYVNYWLNLPRVKISGNYVVQVFQNNNKNDVLFSRRFVVYENVVGINPNVRVSSSVAERRKNHQIDFDVQFSAVKTGNPNNEFKVVIRQNQRWDNAITNLKPTLVNRGNAILEYRPFDGSNNFKAGNEFRFIDLRTVTFRGRYISKIDPAANPTRAEVSLAEGNDGKFYSQINDMNGNYFIQTVEAGAGYLESDYLNVKFQLKSAPITDPVYLVGAFNFWKKDDRSMMQYDTRNGVYFRNILMKQGMYDYQYWVDGHDPMFFEASFYQAGNTYEIIVYHKSFTDLADRVVGYRLFQGRL
ncbi:MAG: DUF5103 domain-containing protein [Reichenbachiella sp.]